MKGITVSFIFLMLCGGVKAEGLSEFFHNFAKGFPEEDNGTLLTYKTVTYQEGDIQTIGAEVVKAKNSESIKIPAAVEIEGEELPVIGIGADAFLNNTVKTLEMPPSIKYIEGTAFKNTFITDLYISDLSEWCRIDFKYSPVDDEPNKVYRSEANPLRTYTKFYVKGNRLINLIIPEDVESLKPFVFDKLMCDSIIINDRIREIPPYAFEYSTARYLKLGSSVASIGVNAAISSRLETVVFPESLKSMYIHSLGGYRYVIPNIDMWLGIEYANTGIYRSRNYYSLYLPDGSAVADLVVPDTYTSLDPLALTGCVTLQSVTFPEGMTLLDENVISYCPSLETVTLPSTLQQMGLNFEYCPNLQYMTILCENPPEVLWTSFSVALWISRIILYVPEESVMTYQRSSPFWGKCRYIRPIDSSGINSVSVSSEGESVDIIYNLQGVRMNCSRESLPKGIYVIDGKKVFVNE